jgi:competence protein ComEC
LQEGPHALLVDTGPDDAIVEALARQHVWHVDGIVLTHLHDDHYGGLLELSGHLSCDRVLVAHGVAGRMPPELAAACEELAGGRVDELYAGDVLHMGGFEIRVVWPWDAVSGQENADSLELLASYGQAGTSLTVLLTGDAEQEQTGAVAQAGLVGDIDVLKVGHHGSDASIDERTAVTLAPELAIASAGEGNAFGHPRERCVRTLEGAGALFVCTKDVGDVEVRPGAGGPVVSCAGGSAVERRIVPMNDDRMRRFDLCRLPPVTEAK